MTNSIAIGVAYKDQAIVGGSIDNTPIGATTPSTVAATQVSGANGYIPIINTVDKSNGTAAINATATATAAQIATGYITSTSAAATTITLPTGTLLGAALGASQGTQFSFWVDNTAGANTVTIAVATNGILSAAAAAGAGAGAGLLTVPAGVTGLAQFTLAFSSATAYVFSRTA